MEEKRKVTRNYLVYYLRVYNAQTNRQVGYLINITTLGAMLLCDDPLPINKTFHFKLELSEEVSKKPYLEFYAESVWCHPDIDPHFYNAGFRFTELSAENEEIIECIIQTYGIHQRRKTASNP